MTDMLHNLRDRLFGRRTKIECYAVKRGPYYMLYRINGQTIVDGVCLEEYHNYVGIIDNGLFPETKAWNIIKFTIETDGRSLGTESTRLTKC